jgi:hypothetical protein
MSPLAAEYQDVFQLYLKLGKELEKILEIDYTKNPGAYVESILANRDHLIRIEKMNDRVLRLTEDWEERRMSMDPAAQEGIREIAGAAKEQAVRLKKLFGVHAERLQAIRDRLGKDLAQIGKGAEYLKSVKPIKSNYPKFIDSLY